MKRDARVKVVYFLMKKTTFTQASQEKDYFHSGVSLHFRPVIVRYGFSTAFFQIFIVLEMYNFVKRPEFPKASGYRLLADRALRGGAF